MKAARLHNVLNEYEAFLQQCAHRLLLPPFAMAASDSLPFDVSLPTCAPLSSQKGAGRVPDLGHGLLRMDIISRKNLERFLGQGEAPKPNSQGVYTFRAQVTFCHKDDFSREFVDVAMYVKSNVGHVALLNSGLAARHGFSDTYSTQTHVMKINDGILIVLGKPGEDYVMWIRYADPTKHT